jgi:hypothetical protein
VAEEGFELRSVGWLAELELANGRDEAVLESGLLSIMVLPRVTAAAGASEKAASPLLSSSAESRSAESSNSLRMRASMFRLCDGERRACSRDAASNARAQSSGPLVSPTGVKNTPASGSLLWHGAGR